MPSLPAHWIACSVTTLKVISSVLRWPEPITPAHCLAALDRLAARLDLLQLLDAADATRAWLWRA